MSQPIAVVTGSNRGLGKETSGQLAVKGYLVIVTARRLNTAQQAVKELGNRNLVEAQLDVTDLKSVELFTHWLVEQYAQVDLLINNAAIHYDVWQNATNAELEIVQQAMGTNVYGSWRMNQALLPLLRNSRQGCIVNVTSGAGALDSMSGATPAYSLSKISLNALTIMFANQLRPDGIDVNAVCPGWMATDMGGAGGRSVQDGAEGIVWVATLPHGSPSGGFYRDGKRIDFA